MPLLSLREVVVFPGTVVPIFIGREKSLQGLLAAKKINDGNFILLSTQKKQDIEDPSITDLFKVGVLAKIIQTVKLPNNNAKILVEAVSRVKLSNLSNNHFFTADYQILSDKEVHDIEALTEATNKTVEMFKEYARFNKKINLEVIHIIGDQKNPSITTNIIASHIIVKIEIKQKLLEQIDVYKRCEMLSEIITKESTIIDTENALQQRVRKQITK